ncbi:MAG: hypothetical protein MJ110_02490 [Lachnospiraceae bacterium]|nr:hypothetical protein [Lachnospiraceae bacterium]
MKKYRKLSLVLFAVAVVLFVINYFVFHYVTDDGIVLIKQEEAGKPFITMLIGILATNFLFTSIFVLIKGKIYGD